MKKAFAKFGRLLTCSETGKVLFAPKNLKVKHLYQRTKSVARVEDVLVQRSAFNERVDQEAKKAAEGPRYSSPREKLPAPLRTTLPHSKATLREQYSKHAKNQARLYWHRSPRYARLAHIDKSLPADTFNTLTAGLKRRHQSILIQLRTGHAPLNEHLFRIKRSETPRCPACRGGGHETVFHYLLVCPHHSIHRRRYLHPLGREADLVTALLSNPKAIKPLMRYIAATGRFKGTHGDLSPPPDPEE